jgi:hypothetical protein
MAALSRRQYCRRSRPAARLLLGQGVGGETVDWTATCINLTVGTAYTITATLSTYPLDGRLRGRW